MSVKAGSFSISATGNVTFGSFSFQPEEIHFRVGPQTATTDTSVTQQSLGWATVSNQSYDSVYRDSTGPEQMAGTDKCIRLRKRVSGTMQDRLAASFVSFNEDVPGIWSATINVTTADVNRQVRFITRG